MKVLASAVLGFLMLLSGSVALADANTGAAHGYVRSDRGTPLAGATVELVNEYDIESATTDKNGFFSILSTYPGLSRINVQVRGYSEDFCPAYVRIGADQRIDLGILTMTTLHVMRGPCPRRSALLAPGVTADVYDVF